MSLPGDQLEATVVDTIFRNEDNGYSVLNVRYGRSESTVVGQLPPLFPDESVTFYGQWVEHPSYGRQFKADACQPQRPTSLLGIERFLASGFIKGVRKATARTLVERFGEKTLDAMADPEKLALVRGISLKRAKQIAQSFAEQYGVRSHMIFLQSYGVAPALAMKIAKAYGDETENVMRNNPYRIIDDVDGAGFLTADRIALKLGLPADSEHRLEYGIKYVLSEAAASSGHTCLPEDILLKSAADILRETPEAMRPHLDRLILRRDLVAGELEGVRMIYLSGCYYAEVEVAARLIKLSNTATADEVPGLAEKIAAYERDNLITLAPKQRQAVMDAVRNGVFVVTGGPGTGKTTIIRCILALLKGKVRLAAPTGRAAKRMSEATGREAGTLHRLLGAAGQKAVFEHDQDNPLNCDCVIVDEMSMVDIFLMRALLRALREGTRLILVGDADQLPSVGAGNVLRDILDANVLKSARLTDIYRQDNLSMIVTNAHRINRGELPILNKKGSDFFYERHQTPQQTAEAIVRLCVERLPAYLRTADPLHDIQVITPTHKGPCGTQQLNQLLQVACNPGGGPQLVYGDHVFRAGDKVMHIKNDYQLAWQTPDGEEGEGVFNGDMGIVDAVDPEENTLQVRFDDDRLVEYDGSVLDELELAYAVTVHKSQGCEFPAVVMPVTYAPRMLLTRNLFYTALTRARRLVVLAGTEEIISQMTANNYIARRYTGLKLRLIDQAAPFEPFRDFL